MSYSEALMVKPKPTPMVPTSTFNVRHPRRKNNAPPPRSRRICVEDDSDTEDTPAKSLLAVQQLSETTREISPTWDRPIDAHHTLATQSIEHSISTTIARYTKPTPVTNANANTKPAQNPHKPSQRGFSRVRLAQMPSLPPRPVRMCADKQCGTRSWASPIRCTCHDSAGLYVDKPGMTIETDKGTCFLRIPDHFRFHHFKHPKSKIKKEKVTFLSLPAEIRNQIYAQVLPKCRVLILRSHPNKELALVKNDWARADQQCRRPRAQLYHKLDNYQIDQGLEMTGNLLLSCREIKVDIERYLYSRTVFCFDSTKVLNSFLRQASPYGLQAIEKLEISLEGYGNPELTENAIFRDRYYNQWTKTCAEIGRKLTGLKHLKVNARLQEWPCDMSQLGTSGEWRRPFLLLAPKRIAKVEIVLQHSMFDQNTRLLRDIAHKLEDDMMTDEGCQERDLAETKVVLARMKVEKAAEKARRRAEEAKENAPTELTITMDEIKQQKNTPIKYCNTGLEKYTKLDMTMMAPVELQEWKEEPGCGKFKPWTYI